MIDLRTTTAYSNSFFKLSQSIPEKADLEMIVKEWYPVTQAFCLNLPKYNALFAQEVLASSGTRRERLEEAMLTPLLIAAEEFGQGRFGLDGIHYRMFARLAVPLGIDLQELQACPFGGLRETTRLVIGIREAFEDLYAGAACIRVVEGTAYQIVEAMAKTFGERAVGKEGRSYSDYEFEYIALHLEIEKEHDVLADDFLSLLCDSNERAEELECALTRMSDLFGEFWEALALASFRSKSAVAFDAPTTRFPQEIRGQKTGAEKRSIA